MARGEKKKKEKRESCPEACRAMCCRYVATKIDAPRTKIDWDEIYWFLCHENVEVFLEARKWYVLFDTPCRNLNGISRCAVYPKRPHVCRQHEEEDCEYWAKGGQKVTMRSPEDLKHYMKRRGIRLRMAWDEPADNAGNRASSGFPFRSTRKPRTGQSKV